MPLAPPCHHEFLPSALPLPASPGAIAPSSETFLCRVLSSPHLSPRLVLPLPGCEHLLLQARAGVQGSLPRPPKLVACAPTPLPFSFDQGVPAAHGVKPLAPGSRDSDAEPYSATSLLCALSQVASCLWTSHLHLRNGNNNADLSIEVFKSACLNTRLAHQRLAYSESQ